MKYFPHFWKKKLFKATILAAARICPEQARPNKNRAVKAKIGPGSKRPLLDPSRPQAPGVNAKKVRVDPEKATRLGDLPG